MLLADLLHLKLCLQLGYLADDCSVLLLKLKNLSFIATNFGLLPGEVVEFELLFCQAKHHLRLVLLEVLLHVFHLFHSSYALPLGSLALLRLFIFWPNRRAGRLLRPRVFVFVN